MNKKQVPLCNLRFAMVSSRLGFKNKTIRNYLEISEKTYYAIANGKRDLRAKEIQMLEYIGINHSWLLGLEDFKVVLFGVRTYVKSRMRLKKALKEREKNNV